ncbi:MAG TPA: LPS assembly protein LptD [Coxiellaceae bacterium]|nr:LPS assembly protein LptD [Coxiellaceae bacterium]
MKKQLTYLVLALINCWAVNALANEIAEPKRELANFKTPSPCKPDIDPVTNRPLGSSTAAALGWMTTTDPANLCHGYFTEPISLSENPEPGSPNSVPTTITGDAVTKLTANGESVLEGNIVLTQPGRIIKAQKAYINRDGKTGRIVSVELFDKVSLEEHGKRVLGSHAFLRLSNHTIIIDDVLYHLYHIQNKKALDSWGRAKRVEKENSGLLVFQDASYSNASPVNPAWEIAAKKIVLNQDEGWGKAYHSVLKFYDKPIFYFPYYSFPIDARRKTGLLQPTAGYSQKNGLDIRQPIYLNLAPNYDWTITPRLMTERGMQFENTLRYLSLKNSGSLYFTYLPNDRQFQNFKNEIFSLYPNNSTYEPYLNRLSSDSNNRGFISAENKWQINENWVSHLNLNYVSDDYYFQDFGSSGGFGTAQIGNTLSSQLLNQYDIEYSNDNWNFTSLVQAYQTLHPINQPTNNDQYRRLPEVDLNANYPNQWHGLGLSLESQAVNFGYQSDFTPDQPVGQRLHVRPGVNLPINWASAYLTPEILWDITGYNVQQPLPGQANSTVRNLPLVNIDSGLYFDRQFNFSSHRYIQTLEPEVFNLYVPYKNQDTIPVYDTQLQPFTVSQLYVTNAFTGFDRIQNANQVSVGLNSRLLDAENGIQKLSMSLGVISYFEKPKVCLSANCIPAEDNLSPIVGQLTYNQNSAWSATANMAWDPNVSQTNNAALNLNYLGNHNQTATLAYQFVHGTAGTANSNLVQAGGSWPIAYHWNTLGYINYNINQRYTQNIYAGVEYDDCGWALRMIASRNYTGLLPTGNQYENAYYVQFQLTGLGSLGNGSPSGLLSTLPGYQDSFR